jgi:hypothetical protein
LERVRRTAPTGLIVTTMAGIVLVNLLLAQIVLRLAYPDSGFQLGTASLIGLAVVTIFGVMAMVRGWREFLGATRARRKPRA